MTVNIYIPGDSGSLALAADKVALAIASEAEERGLDIKIVRNGSRGLYWLEPMVEVETFEGRVAYGPVKARDVKSLFDAGLAEGKGDHGLSLGDPEEIPFLKRQTRLTFARCGIVDPLSLEDYRAHGGIRGLEKALAMSPEEIVAEVTESGLRGRGGAGFPTGIKWKTVLEAQADRKYIVCNGDEGDSGTFADRMILEGDPFVLIEGMVIAGLAVGATKGYIYMRSEYPHAIEMTEKAIEIARDANILGPSVLMSGQAFELEVRVGAGAYVCGEETALLDSLEGKRGVVRAKPPLPAHKGFLGKPTVINNLVSLASVPIILDKGGPFYKDFGLGRSRGTIPIQIAGNVKYGGLYEDAFGLTLGEIVEDIAGGFALTGRMMPNAFNIRAVASWRIYADGRPDELVRGIDLVGTPFVAFSNLIAAGDTPEVFNGTCGAESGWVPVSAVAPPLLFERLEFQLKEKGQDRPPLLDKPLPAEGSPR